MKIGEIGWKGCNGHRDVKGLEAITSNLIAVQESFPTMLSRTSLDIDISLLYSHPSLSFSCSCLSGRPFILLAVMTRSTRSIVVFPIDLCDGARGCLRETQDIDPLGLGTISKCGHAARRCFEVICSMRFSCSGPSPH